MEQLNSPIVYKVIAFFGVLLVFLPSIIVVSLPYNHKNKDDFTKQVFIPSIIGLFFVMFAYYFLLKEITDELFFQVLIGITVIFSIGINSGVIFMSMLRMRWAAD